MSKERQQNDWKALNQFMTGNEGITPSYEASSRDFNSSENTENSPQVFNNQVLDSESARLLNQFMNQD